MFTQTAKWWHRVVCPTSSECLFRIMKVLSAQCTRRATLKQQRRSQAWHTLAGWGQSCQVTEALSSSFGRSHKVWDDSARLGQPVRGVNGEETARALLNRSDNSLLVKSTSQNQWECLHARMVLKLLCMLQCSKQVSSMGLVLAWKELHLVTNSVLKSWVISCHYIKRNLEKEW